MLTDGQLADRISQFERACQAAGSKLTFQRIEILREVARFDGHPTADRVLEGVRSRIPTISIDTVYRTLWLLTDFGLVTTVGPRRDAVLFDANLLAHDHYVCVRCGETQDIPELDLGPSRWADRILALGSVISVHLEIRGICTSCQQKTAKAPITGPSFETGSPVWEQQTSGPAFSTDLGDFTKKQSQSSPRDSSPDTTSY